MYSNVTDGARISPAATRCGAFRTFQRATALAHSPGISASATSRARASSPRLVSWVAVAVMPCGQSVARTSIAWWNAAVERPAADGRAAPALVEREEAGVAIEGGALERLRHPRPVNCCTFRAKRRTRGALC